MTAVTVLAVCLALAYTWSYRFHFSGTGTLRREPVVFCWISVSAVLTLRLGSERTAEAVATSGASAANVLELAVLGLVGLYAVKRIIGGNVPIAPLGLAILMPFPALGLLSTMWSTLPLLSFSRGAEMMVIGVLGVLTMGLESTVRPGLIAKVLNTWALTIALLSALGLALGSANSDGRATWPTVHPVVAGSLSGIALLILLSDAARELPRWTRIPAGACLGVMLTLSYTRTAIAAFIVGAIALAWFRSTRRHAGPTRVAVIALISIAGAVVWASIGIVRNLAARGENPEDLGQLNGRRELFEYITDRVAADGNMVLGYGFNASRIVLLEGREWAGTAHNGLYQSYADLGIVGAATLILCFIVTLVLSARHSPSTSRQLSLALLANMLVTSIASEAIALPTASYCLFSLVAGWVVAEHIQVGRGKEPNRPLRSLRPVGRNRGNDVSVRPNLLPRLPAQLPNTGRPTTGEDAHQGGSCQ